MSVGHFRVQGYNIRLNVDSFRISTPTKLGLSIMGAYHPDGSEPIQIRVFNPLQALVETERSIFRLEYIEDNDEPNGQIEIDVKMGDGEIPSWTALLNGVPREVIRIAIAILNGDDETDDYRVVPNSNIQNDPEVEAEPEYNYGYGTNSNTVTSPRNGGRRRTQRKKKRSQRKA